MPTEPAAVSLAAMARRARPMRVRSMLRPIHTAPRASAQVNQKNSRSSASGKPSTRNFGRPVMPIGAAGERHLDREHDQHQMQRQRRHRQHEAAQLQDRRADAVGGEHRDRGPGQHRQERVPAVLHAQDRVGIAADHAERRLADRELVREAQQQDQPDGADRHRPGADPEAEMIAVRQQQRVRDHRRQEGHGGNRIFPAGQEIPVTTRPPSPPHARAGTRRRAAAGTPAARRTR